VTNEALTSKFRIDVTVLLPSRAVVGLAELGVPIRLSEITAQSRYPRSSCGFVCASTAADLTVECCQNKTVVASFVDRSLPDAERQVTPKPLVQKL
jgi:hypothetical protein